MAIALTWTLSTLIYGLFVTRSRWLRRISQICFGLSLVAGLTTISVAASVPAVRAQLSSLVDRAITEAAPRSLRFFDTRSMTGNQAASGKVTVEVYGRRVLASLRDNNTPFDLKKFQISTLHLLGEEIRPTVQDALRYYRQKPAAKLSAQEKELAGLLEKELRRLHSAG